MSSEGFDSGARSDDEQTDGQVPTGMQLEKADEYWRRRGQWLANVPRIRKPLSRRRGGSGATSRATN